MVGGLLEIFLPPPLPHHHITLPHHNLHLILILSKSLCKHPLQNGESELIEAPVGAVVGGDVGDLFPFAVDQVSEAGFADFVY